MNWLQKISNQDWANELFKIYKVWTVHDASFAEKTNNATEAVKLLLHYYFESVESEWLETLSEEIIFQAFIRTMDYEVSDVDDNAVKIFLSKLTERVINSMGQFKKDVTKDYQRSILGPNFEN